MFLFLVQRYAAFCIPAKFRNRKSVKLHPFIDINQNTPIKYAVISHILGFFRVLTYINFTHKPVIAANLSASPLRGFFVLVFVDYNLTSKV